MKSLINGLLGHQEAYCFACDKMTNLDDVSKCTACGRKVLTYCSICKKPTKFDDKSKCLMCRKRTCFCIDCKSGTHFDDNLECTVCGQVFVYVPLRTLVRSHPALAHAITECEEGKEGSIEALAVQISKAENVGVAEQILARPRKVLQEAPRKKETRCKKAETDPSFWGISYQQLMSFQREHWDQVQGKTMREVVNEIIKPLWQTTKKSVALQKNPFGKKVHVFVTHSWDEDFVGFVKSIKDVYHTYYSKPNFFICSFSLPQGGEQHITSLLGKTVEESPFYRALKEAQDFCVIRNSTTDIYMRSWCIAEIIVALKFGLAPAKMKIAGPNTFRNTTTRSIDATATKFEDREMIMTYLQAESYHLIDHLIDDIRRRPED